MPTFPGFISEQNSGGLIIRDLELEPLASFIEFSSGFIYQSGIKLTLPLLCVGI
jgi:hypothetical protein